ncbi:MAG: hypothetical protein F6J86_30360 [Symploca sp. SIO1B1]|nr:hypothetical protein [Symploca sp. SIO1B1]
MSRIPQLKVGRGGNTSIKSQKAGDREARELVKIFTLTNSQFPIPNSQFPIPHSQNENSRCQPYLYC